MSLECYSAQQAQFIAKHGYLSLVWSLYTNSPEYYTITSPAVFSIATLSLNVILRKSIIHMCRFPSTVCCYHLWNVKGITVLHHLLPKHSDRFCKVLSINFCWSHWDTRDWGVKIRGQVATSKHKPEGPRQAYFKFWKVWKSQFYLQDNLSAILDASPRIRQLRKTVLLKQVFWTHRLPCAGSPCSLVLQCPALVPFTDR